MITVEDACREIQSEHPDKQYELDHSQRIGWCSFHLHTRVVGMLRKKEVLQ